MLSKSRSHVFSRKGSIERSRASKLGYRGPLELMPSFCDISARLEGSDGSDSEGFEGI